MKYTFQNNGKDTTVEIEDAWINKQSRLLGITKREAIEMWLCDEGYISNDTVDELTAKAKANKTGAVGAATKPRKKPERKPDMTKRALIEYLFAALGGDDSTMLDLECGNPENVKVTNIERMIAFNIGDDKFELTLSKKRKPKN